METKTTSTTIDIKKTEKPHSYEFGKAGARHKIYYETVDELHTQIEELKECGYIIEDGLS